MSIQQQFTSGVILVALFLAGCGDSKKEGPAAGGGRGGNPASGTVARGAAPAALLDLLPKGTVGFAYAPSLQALEDGIRKIVAAVDEEQARSMDFDDLVRMVRGFNSADLDMAKGAALALTLVPDAEVPGYAVILPVRNEESIAAKVKAKNPAAVVEVAGGFAAISPKGGYQRGGMPQALKGTLPAGEFVVRLDMAALAKSFGPMVFAEAEQGLEMLEGMSAGAPGTNPTAILKPMLDGLKAVIEASSVWDLAFRIDGTEVEAELAMGFAEGAKVPLLDMFSKADLAGLARGIPGNGMMTMAVAVDPSRLWEALGGFLSASLQAYPEDQRASLQSMFDLAGKAMKHVGQGMVMNGGFTSSGMEFVGMLETPDAAAYVKTISDLSAGLDPKGTFFSIAPVDVRTLEGTRVHGWKIKIDSEKMPMAATGIPGSDVGRKIVDRIYGKDGMTFHAAEFGTKVLIVIGGDEALNGALKSAKGGGSATDLGSVLTGAGPDTVGFVRMDFRALMREAFAMVSQADTEGQLPKFNVPAGGPLPLTITTNAGPRQLRTRLVLDVGEFARLFMDMLPR